MDEFMDYYLIDGSIQICKEELIFKLLRKDSVLYIFSWTNSIKPPFRVSKADNSKNMIILDFGEMERIKLAGDTTPQLEKLKQRYGANINGKLYFIGMYSLTNQIYQLEADFNTTKMSLQMNSNL